MNVKINEEIKEYCKILKLKGVLDTFEDIMKDAKDYEDYLHRLLENEIGSKDDRAVECRIRNAKFPFKKYLEDLELQYLPERMQEKLPFLSTLDFIEKGQNVIMYGNPGTGKTHVSIGLGIKACIAGYKVLFTTIPLLVTQLKECNSRKTLTYFERRFEKYDLIIADEMGYISFDKEGSELLFTNLSLRASRKSIIITTNLAFDRWDEIFGDPVITSAMVDRLTHKAYIIDMQGDSYRLRETLALAARKGDKVADECISGYN